MNPDHDRRAFATQFNAIVTSYLDGDLSFQTATERLATVLRAEHAMPRTAEEIQQDSEDIERWGKDGGPVIIARQVFKARPGRTSAEHARFHALLEAAMHRAFLDKGAA